MDTFSPPNLISNYNSNSAISIGSLKKVTGALNRYCLGVNKPQVIYPQVAETQYSLFFLQVIGTAPNILFCIPATLFASPTFPADQIVPVLQPFPLDQGIYFGDRLYVYDASLNISKNYTVTFGSPNFSADGNARKRVRSDGVSEIEVISPAYMTESEAGFILAASLPHSPVVNATVPAGNYWSAMLGRQYPQAFPIPAALVGTPINMIDLNVAARHWVAQTVS